MSYLKQDHLTNVKMATVETHMCRLAGAIYRSTDMIIMEEHKDRKDNTRYLKVTLTVDDVFEKSATYKMIDVPDYVETIYNYVNQASIMEHNVHDKTYTLYGDHIGRTRYYKFTLGIFSTNPLALDKVHHLPLDDNDDDINQLLLDISKKMRAVKAV